MNKIKVIYVLSASTKYGGANKSFYLMLVGLINKGIEPLVILPEDGGLCEFFKKDNIPYKIFPYYFTRYPALRKKFLIKDILMYIPRLIRGGIYNILAESKLKKIVLDYTPSLIHSNVGPIHIGYNVAKKLHISHIWHLREYQTLDFGIKPFVSMSSFRRKLNFEYNRCIVITKGIFDYFALDENKGHKVIYNGVLKSSDTCFVSEKEKYFLYAGRLEKNKGIYNLIKAFIDFAQKDKVYNLYIAGDTTDKNFKKSLVELVEKNNLYDRVVFLGMRDDVYSLMRSATALIVPSLSEGFGRITVEAMFNGCLVIGYDNAGTQEILKSETLGLLYRTTEELVKIMEQVVMDGIEAYYPLMKKAQQKALMLYSQESHVDLVYNYYCNVILHDKISK